VAFLFIFFDLLAAFQQTTFNPNSGQHRLSPQQQMLTNFSNINSGNNTNNSSNNSSNAQLSPRQPPFNIQPNTQVQATQANWIQQQQQQSSSNNIRLNLQQSNPMLNAQLSVRFLQFLKMIQIIIRKTWF
jgi:hypothetical protein